MEFIVDIILSLAAAVCGYAVKQTVSLVTQQPEHKSFWLIVSIFLGFCNVLISCLLYYL